MFFFWRLQCTKKLRNSPLCPREWSSIKNGRFSFDFFSFYYRLGTVSCQITCFQKTVIIWVFQRNFMFFFEDCNVPKNCEILRFVHGSEAQSKMEDFGWSLLFLLPFRNSIMPNNTFSKKSIIWVFQRNFCFFLKIAMYQKIAKFSTLSTGVKFNQKWKFSSVFSLFIRVYEQYHLTNNTFSKTSVIWVFQRNFILFLKIAMYQKIAKFSTLSTGVKLNKKWKFSSIFSLFIRVFTNSIMPNNTFSKNCNNWSFSTKF